MAAYQELAFNEQLFESKLPIHLGSFLKSPKLLEISCALFVNEFSGKVYDKAQSVRYRSSFL